MKQRKTSRPAPRKKPEGGPKRTYFGAARGVGPFTSADEMKGDEQIPSDFRRGLNDRLKLSSIAGNKTSTREEWLRTRKVLRSTEMITRRKLEKHVQ